MEPHGWIIATRAPPACRVTKEEAGRTLHIAASTVHTHTIHIDDKIGGRTRAAMALFAMEHGLLR